MNRSNSKNLEGSLSSKSQTRVNAQDAGKPNHQGQQAAPAIKETNLPELQQNC